MSTITTGGSGNWSSGDGVGPWTGTTKPVTNDSVVIAAGHAVTLDENTATLGLISSVSGTLTVSGSRTITGKVKYTGTSTSGMVIVPTGQTLTITGPGSGIAVENTSDGFAVVTAGTATLSVVNTGANACTNSGWGRAILHGGSGNLTITGSSTAGTSSYGQTISTGSATVTVTGAGLVTDAATGTLLQVTGAGTVNWTGDFTCSGGGNLFRLSNGTVNVIGNLDIAPACSMFHTASSGGTVNWTGSRTLAASTDLNIGTVIGSTLNLSSLVLSCSGRFSVGKGTGTLTLGSGGTLAQIILQSVDASAAILGQAHSGAIIGPTIPDEADVKDGTMFGYLDADEGSYDPLSAAAWPAEHDVLDTDAAFGPTGAEYAGAYHAPEASEVISTAVFGAHSGTSGTYAVGDVAAGNIIDGKSIGGVSGTYHRPEVAEVLSTAQFGVAPQTGSYVAPVQASVLCVADGGTAYGAGSAVEGLATLPAAANVQAGAADYGVSGALRDPSYPTTATTQAADAAILETDKAYLLATKTITFGASSVTGTLAVGNVLSAVTGGTYHVCEVAEVLDSVSFGAGSAQTGTYHAPAVAEVLDSAVFGPASGTSGTYHAPAVAEVLDSAVFGPASGTSGTYHAPDAAEVLSTAVFGPASGTPGTYVVVAAGDVEAGVTFGAASAETGTFVVPTEAQVEDGVEFGNAAEFTGSLAGGGGVIIVRHS